MSHDREDPSLTELAGALRSAWHRFVATFEPLRPALYRYCRTLTGSPWEAEDLVQDTLMRGFATIGGVYPELRNPRVWLFRVASNLWIDRVRHRRHEEPLPDPVPEHAGSASPLSDTRAAGTALIGRLAPQERAAIVLKDVFEFTLEETAEMLATTPGAVKAALHRGRGKLADEPHAESKPARLRIARPVVDAFCDAFNARDLPRLTALLLENATSEIVGMASELSTADMVDENTGSLFHTLFSSLSHAVAPALLAGNRDQARTEVREVHGEPVLLFWYDHDAGPVVRDVCRLTGADDHVATVRYYFFSPDVVADVCEELGLPWRTNGYRYMLPPTDAT